MSPANTSQERSSSNLRVGIVDGHAACRMGITMQLSKRAGASVAWTSPTAEEAFGKLSSDMPDLLIVEIHLPGQDGLEFIKNLRPLYPDLRILVHSSLSEDFYATRCLQAGAMGFLHKAEPMGHLLPALEKILAGEVFLSSRAANKAIQSLRRQSNGAAEDSLGKQLTDRELEIIMLMAAGDSCQETADKLHISPRTVQVHRTNIRNKLGLDSAARLHAYAVRFYGDAAENPNLGELIREEDDGSRRLNQPAPRKSPTRAGMSKNSRPRKKKALLKTRG